MLLETLDQFSDLNKVTGFISMDGRPLAERHASAEVIDQVKANGIQIGTTPSTSSDYRHGIATNMFAYEALEPDFHRIISSIGWLNKVFAPQANGRFLKVDEAMTSIFGGSCLPTFLVNKQNNPLPNNEIPNHVANLYKVSKGILGSLFEISRIMPLVIDNGPLPVELIMAYIRGEEMLVVDFEACPAPEDKIKTVLRALIENRADASKSPLNDLVSNDEIPAFCQYSQAVSAVKTMYRHINERVIELDAKFPGHIDQKLLDFFLKIEIEKLQMLRKRVDSALGR